MPSADSSHFINTSSTKWREDVWQCARYPPYAPNACARRQNTSRPQSKSSRYCRAEKSRYRCSSLATVPLCYAPNISHSILPNNDHVQCHWHDHRHPPLFWSGETLSTPLDNSLFRPSFTLKLEEKELFVALRRLTKFEWTPNSLHTPCPVATTPSDNKPSLS